MQVKVLHADSTPKYNNDDGLIMFCITNQCGYTSSLPSLGKDWEMLWEEEIDADKLTESQETFLDGLYTIEDINSEMVKLKYKVPAPLRAEAPRTPINNLISQEFKNNNSNQWKEAKQPSRAPFKKATKPTRMIDNASSKGKEDQPKDNSSSELAMIPWGDDAMEIETIPLPRVKRQLEEVNDSSPASGGKSRKKVAKDVSALVIRGGNGEKGKEDTQKADQGVPTRKELEALLAENALLKGQVKQLIETVSRLEKLVLKERKEPNIPSAREEPNTTSAREEHSDTGMKAASGMDSEVARRGGMGSCSDSGDDSNGNNPNVNDAGQGGEENRKGEGENHSKGDKGARGERGSMHPSKQSYAAAAAKPPAEGAARIKRERLRALHLFTAPERVKAPPKEWGVINLKLNLSEKMRKGTTSKEIHHHALRMLEQLKIRKLVTEVSLRGKHVVSLYCIKEHITRVRAALVEAKVTILDKTDALPESPVVREAAVRRVAFLLKRYEYIPKLREVILQNLDCEELTKKSIEMSGVRNDSSI
jgi:hypothetical protein